MSVLRAVAILSPMLLDGPKRSTPRRVLVVIVIAVIVVAAIAEAGCIAAICHGHGVGHVHLGAGVPSSGFSFPILAEERPGAVAPGVDRVSADGRAPFVPPRA